jgi:hypothetical protein
MGLYNHNNGEPIFGRLHSTDASTGVAVPVFKQGSEVEHVLAADEYLVITDIAIITTAGGDAHVHHGTVADVTPSDAKTVIRGGVGANGGVARSANFKKEVTLGDTLFAVAPAGDVDVELTGYIRKQGNTKHRPSWQASQVPGE